MNTFQFDMISTLKHSVGSHWWISRPHSSTVHKITLFCQWKNGAHMIPLPYVSSENLACHTLGLYSLSEGSSYCKILWNIEAARLENIMIVSLWNLTGISACACKISERHEHSNVRSGNFAWSHDRTSYRILSRGPGYSEIWSMRPKFSLNSNIKISSIHDIYCVGLCQIWKRFDNWATTNGQTIFGEISVVSPKYMGQVTKLRLPCYLVLLSIDSKTR